MVGHAVDEATGRATDEAAEERRLATATVVVLGLGQPRASSTSWSAPRRLTLRGDRRAPSRACSRRCASTRTSAGCSCAPREHGALVLGPRGVAPPRPTTASRARTRSPPFSPTAARHLRRTDGFAARRRHHGRQLLRPVARRGLRVRGAHLLPRRPRRPADAAVHPRAAARSRCPPSRSSGAAAVHALLAGWRSALQDSPISSGRAGRARAPGRRRPSATRRRTCGRRRWPAT